VLNFLYSIRSRQFIKIIHNYDLRTKLELITKQISFCGLLVLSCVSNKNNRCKFRFYGFWTKQHTQDSHRKFASRAPGVFKISLTKMFVFEWFVTSFCSVSTLIQLSWSEVKFSYFWDPGICQKTGSFFRYRLKRVKKTLESSGTQNQLDL